MCRPTQDQRLPAEEQTFYSPNVVEGVCFRHAGPDEGVKPLFACAACGRRFCPLCATGVWHAFTVSGRRVVWYRCPDCPIGLAFIALPLDGPISPEAAAGANGWYVRVTSDSVLQRTRPGACRVLFPKLKQRGAYEAFGDGAKQCLLQLGEECLSWVQQPDGVQLAGAAADGHETLISLVVGEYLLVEPPQAPGGTDPPLVLFLDLPQGYEEYDMPAGWPADGAPRRLDVTDRTWTPDRLMAVLPALAGPGQDGRKPAGPRAA